MSPDNKNRRLSFLAAVLLGTILLLCAGRGLTQSIPDARSQKYEKATPLSLNFPDQRKFSLALNDLSLSEAIRFLIQDTGFHVVEEESLSVPTHGRLDSVTVSEALQILAQRYDLSYRFQDSNFIVGRTKSSIFSINHIVEPESGLWEELGENLKGLLSSNGRLVLNTYTGTASIIDAPSAIQRVSDFLAAVESDYSKQVIIEAKIVEVRLSEDNEVGVDWTVFSKGWDNVTGNTPAHGIFEQRTVSGMGVFQFGLVNSGRADILVDMLNEQGQLDVISQPKVVTMGNHPATFRATQTVPYFVVDVIPTDGASPYIQYDLEFRDAGVTLDVLTHVGTDGQITVQVHPVVSEITGYTAALPNLPSQPIIDVRETQTTVRMRDGETLVIGGLLYTRDEEEHRGIPILSSIPIIKHLFGNTKTSTKKVEMVVFLTPRILPEMAEDHE
ncbi:MAG: hypothetical protein KJ970_03755 [Candidatus Eisenbacteria bacterium]|uniref:Type II/III secretion system secretin-like domain-containing protein n=1 Tax=Eiseniibacteriota bacterium TaxID=2212470 RepID=A0A948RV46_UNCEI|nr:hypothetical protein [Candidatus Eisenbacteria bacterium]MBU1949905.1 hypothetical protein [Candidatus Eisenbacteria bacterium]MBU2690017.1 hypothetical protein [Candidatus Eisenbacteria bacterium]